MKTIETTVTVLPDGSIRFHGRADLPPGEHRAVLVIDSAEPRVQTARPPLELKMLDTGPWPEGFTARREELYDDDGR